MRRGSTPRLIVLFAPSVVAWSLVVVVVAVVLVAPAVVALMMAEEPAGAQTTDAGRDGLFSRNPQREEESLILRERE